MLSLLLLLAGMVNTLTVMQNGQLSAVYGRYSSVVIVHAVGLATASLCYLATRKRLPPKRPAPPWMYLGGVIGVGTVVLVNAGFSGVSVAAVTALGLLGQTLASIVVDQLGLLGVEKSPFVPARLWAVLATVAGVAVMLFPLGESSPMAALCALGSGFTIVTARTINGRLATIQGPMRSTLMNYVTGLCTVAAVALLLGRGEPLWTGVAPTDNWFMYLGGACGVCLIMLLNLTVPRVSVFSCTLLQFTGQILMSLLLDTLLTGAFAWRSLAGGVLVALGLLLDAALRRR